MEDSEKILNIQKQVSEFVEERNWCSSHNPKNLAMSIAIESAELMEIFQWKSNDESATISDLKVLEHIGEEIADVMIYCLSMANQFGMDAGEIIKDKIRKNVLKYPIK